MAANRSSDKSSVALAPAVREAVMAMLACPACRSALRMDGANQKPEIVCLGCARRFPVVDGIPVLIVEQSRGQEAVAQADAAAGQP